MSSRVKPEIAARNRRMAAMYRQGVTLEKIGSQFGITRERVRQILRREGVDAKDGGQAKRIQLAGGSSVEKKRAAMRKAQEEKTGVSYDLLQALRAEGHTKAYRQHKNNSASRGIAFDLTLGQWWAVWQSSGHAHERGRGVGKYCMSRINDSGGYTLGNVHIQPCVENSRDAVAVWKDRLPKKHPGVFLLYPGRRRPYMAKVGEKVLGYFATEEDAVQARNEYAAQIGVVTGRSGLGKGRGWTLLKGNKARPYQMQGPGGARGYFATQEEAEAAYRAACEAHIARLQSKEVA